MVKNESSYLVVGGTSGIGKALVGQLVKIGRVTMWSRNSADDLPGGATHFGWDATSDDTPPEVPHQLDGLAYCPGSIRLKPIARLTNEDFR